MMKRTSLLIGLLTWMAVPQLGLADDQNTLTSTELQSMEMRLATCNTVHTHLFNSYVRAKEQIADFRSKQGKNTPSLPLTLEDRLANATQALSDNLDCISDLSERIGRARSTLKVSAVASQVSRRQSDEIVRGGLDPYYSGEGRRSTAGTGR